MMDKNPGRVPTVHNWIVLSDLQEIHPQINKKNASNSILREFLGNKKPSDITQKALYPVMFIAQCFGIMPVSGKLQDNVERIRFSIMSMNSAFSFLLIITFLAQSTFPFNEAWFREGDINFDLAREFIFDIISTTYLIGFFLLAKDWKNVMRKWHQLEERMRLFEPVNASRKIAIFTGIFMVATILEHSLSYPYDAQCDFTWEGHLKFTRGALFRMTEYATWKGIVSLVINFFMTMTWNFTDLFLSSMSIALGSKFTQFNLEIEKSIKMKENRVAYWKRMRESYNHLALFTKFMDKTLSAFVLLSYFNNLFFICFQLLNNIKLRKKQLYFAISFGHILFRFCCVSFTAAAIYERSKKPTKILFSVPHDRYNVEVHRLLLQVLLDRLTLTGYNFFSITKGLLLTVAGTILTYEIFLIQVDSLKPDNFYENDTVDCGSSKS